MNKRLFIATVTFQLNYLYFAGLCAKVEGRRHICYTTVECLSWLNWQKSCFEFTANIIKGKFAFSRKKGKSVLNVANGNIIVVKANNIGI